MANTNLNTVQTAITAWVESASSLQMEWGKEPQKVHMGAFVLGYAGAMTKLGHDERISTYVIGNDETVVRVVGVRLLPLRLSFRSFDQRLGGSARQYAEEFRTLIHSDTSFDLLAAAELALVDTGELIETDYVWSNRTVSQVDLTVTLSLRADFTDPLHDGSYIGSVNYDAQVDTDGDLDYTDREWSEEITT